MKTTSLSKILSFIVAMGGLVVMVGWINDIDALKSVVPGFVTMKFSTALSFLSVGLMHLLVYINIDQEDLSDFFSITISTISYAIFFFMLLLMIEAISGFSLGFSNLFIEESDNAVKSVGPGIPSLGTIAAFALITWSGVVATLKGKKARHTIKNIGVLVMAIALLALIGYVVDQPFLYYFIDGKSTGMAIHTSILFVLMGVSMIFNGSKEENAQLL